MDLPAPPIPLTLRAMHRIRHSHGRSLGLPAVAVVSVLALLASACFPVLAQAETVYTPEQTTIPGGQTGTAPIKHKNLNPHESSPQATSSVVPGGGGSGNLSPEYVKSQNGASNESSGSGSGQGQSKQGNGPSHPGGNVQTATPVPSSTEAGEGSSSPLVPILIAVAVLAAISIGAVLLRQRRQRADGSHASPTGS
jgi:hypothetical protein